MPREDGYKNLEKGRWKPGQSGNPKGRPKGIPWASKQLVWNTLNETIIWLFGKPEHELDEFLEANKNTKAIPKAQRIFLETKEAAGFEALMDRAIGRPVQLDPAEFAAAIRTIDDVLQEAHKIAETQKQEGNNGKEKNEDDKEKSKPRGAGAKSTRKPRKKKK